MRLNRLEQGGKHNSGIGPQTGSLLAIKRTVLKQELAAPVKPGFRNLIYQRG
jgi:hypothetical protein